MTSIAFPFLLRFDSYYKDPLGLSRHLLFLVTLLRQPLICRLVPNFSVVHLPINFKIHEIHSHKNTAQSKRAILQSMIRPSDSYEMLLQTTMGGRGNGNVV